ncbi:MAG: hypothetical protein GY719_02905 [bacterium]|nr:hypothetical protein [bacterium]
MDLLLGLLDRAVERANDRLEEAENRHHRRLLDVKRLRRQRNEAATDLYRPLVEVRKAVNGLYGGEAVAEILGLEERTARSASPLLEQAGRAVTLLRGWRPYPARAGGTVDPDDWLALLEPPLEQLRTIFVEASPERLRHDPTRDAKRRAITGFDDDFDPALRTVCALLELAGERSVAERLRRQLRRPHRFAHGSPRQPETAPAPVAIRSFRTETILTMAPAAVSNARTQPETRTRPAESPAAFLYLPQSERRLFLLRVLLVAVVGNVLAQLVVDEL